MRRFTWLAVLILVLPSLAAVAQQEQPPLDVKLDALKRYSEEMIAEFR